MTSRWGGRRRRRRGARRRNRRPSRYARATAAGRRRWRCGRRAGGARPCTADPAAGTHAGDPVTRAPLWRDVQLREGPHGQCARGSQLRPRLLPAARAVPQPGCAAWPRAVQADGGQNAAPVAETSRVQGETLAPRRGSLRAGGGSGGGARAVPLCTGPSPGASPALYARTGRVATRRRRPASLDVLEGPRRRTQGVPTQRRRVSAAGCWAPCGVARRSSACDRCGDDDPPGAIGARRVEPDRCGLTMGRGGGVRGLAM